ncbi:MAG: hypothetical protein J3R72DRAFT_458011 [Linnemannia gamsii]|nr:MAG: hypothetical protein J3R72DRAFT_458011 [Linnemannia gamsii]
MACCTATVISSVDQALASTHWHRVVLPVASLEPPYITQNDGSSTAVFDEEDHIIKVLVNDCGGHGRALEGLQEVLEVTTDHSNVELLINRLHDKLHRRYSEAVLVHSPTAQDIARAILTRAFLVRNAPVPGTSSLPRDFAILGLIR